MTALGKKLTRKPKKRRNNITVQKVPLERPVGKNNDDVQVSNIPSGAK